MESFDTTRSHDYRWYLVIADDGSTDGSIEYARSIHLEDCTVVLLENKTKSIAGQANSILACALAIGADFGFKADDDIFFVEAGWDHAYFSAAKNSGWHHLVYHNLEWKAGQHDATHGALRSVVPAKDSMGCFYTFSPDMIEQVGYFDEPNFPFRGHSHIDFTIRACRANFNEEARLWDVRDSGDFIAMWQRDNYQSLVDWDSDDVKKILNPDERARREDVINDVARVYLPHVEGIPGSSITRASVKPYSDELSWRLSTCSIAETRSSADVDIDRAWVLNLAGDTATWETTAGMLSRQGLTFERFPAVDGGTHSNVAEWRDYNDQGLLFPIERTINRRLIQSAGAWGYLKTMEALIETAISQRLRRIMVFDDDIMLHKQFASQFPRVLSACPEGTNLLYLGNSQTDSSLVESIDEMFYHPNGGTNGSFALVIDSSVFSLLLDSIRRFDRPFDDGAVRDIDNADPESVVALHEPLVVADVSTSAIRAPRDLASFAKEFDWRLENYERRDSIDAQSSDRVDVIMIVDNGESELSIVLDALRHQTHASIRITVVDNASTDRTESVIAAQRRRDTRIRHLATSNTVDPANVVNALLPRIESPWTIVLPQLCSVNRDYIASLLETARETGADWVRPAISNTAPPARADHAIPNQHLWIEDAPSNLDVGSLMKTEMLQSIGGFLSLDATGLNEAFLRARASSIRKKADEPIRTTPRNMTAARLVYRVPRSGIVASDERFLIEISAGQRSPRLPSPPSFSMIEHM